MMELLAALENSGFGIWLRESPSIWAYPAVLMLHTLGLGVLVGGNAVLDLRLLGVWRSVPLAALERPALSLAIAGFAVAALSGSALITTNATEYLGNPFLLLKFSAIGLGLLNALVAQTLPAWRARHAVARPPSSDAVLAAVGGTSLVCWLVAVASGRMIGYW